jgi:DNA-binding CsgD family transcriptional regulator
MASTLSNPFLDSLNRFLRGQLGFASGDVGEAEARFHEALEIQQDAALLPGILRTIEAVAAVTIARGKLEDAARLLAYAEQARGQIGLVRGDVEATECKRCNAALEIHLGADALKAVQATVRHSDLTDIIGLISRMRGKRARPLTGWESLTPTENRVVSLAMGGLTNPQIAERMFIARGTVKVHLSHIYEKLDVSSRTQLAAKAVAEGFNGCTPEPD